MNAFEINKIIGAVLGALVFVMGLSVLSDLIFDEHPLDELAYGVDAPPDTSAENEAGESEPEEAFSVLLASADPVAGENSVAVCAACHSFDDGGPNGIGPALYNVVGREIAGVADFGYSNALVTHGEGKTWSYEELNGFLENPQGWVPGTTMSYAGVKDAKERANLVAYLRSISPDAPPLPEVPEATEEAAIEGGETETAAVANEAAPEDATQTDAATDGSTDVASTDAAGTDAPATDSGTDAFTQLVASSDPSTGEANAAVCMACHTVNEGEPNRVGPNLHGIFRAPIAAKEFNYSSAMKTYAESHGEWTIANLNDYLLHPMETVPGTLMAYAGIPDDDTRAAVIAWLHSLSPESGPIVAGGQ